MRGRATILPILAVICLLAVSFPAPTHAAASDFYVPSFAGTASLSAGLVDTVVNVINALLVLAAIAAAVFIIIGGVRYYASQGDEAAVDQAKKNIIFGIIGILLILLSAVIVNFFKGQISGSSSNATSPNSPSGPNINRSP